MQKGTKWTPIWTPQNFILYNKTLIHYLFELISNILLSHIFNANYKDMYASA